jgi:hypothetical protein
MKFITRDSIHLKKIASILLLALFLFNVGGYYLVFWGLERHADNELAARLDSDLYSEEETVELKIALTLPYPIQQQGFERINGKFEHRGEFYKLVKQRVLNDTLYVICIKDQQKKSLNKTMNDYVKLSNDLPGAASKAISLLGKLIKEYNVGAALILATSVHSYSVISFTGFATDLITRESKIASPPPKTLS